MLLRVELRLPGHPDDPPTFLVDVFDVDLFRLPPPQTARGDPEIPSDPEISQESVVGSEPFTKKPTSTCPRPRFT